MIDYYKVYQSIDDTILKNVSEVIKLNGNLEQIYNLLFVVCGLGGLCFLLILVRFVDFFYDFGSKETLKKVEFFGILAIILLILSLVFGVLYSTEENKNEKYSKNIKINNSIKTQKELFSNVMGNKNPKEFLEQGKKLEKFCSFYYSPTDNNFCKNNKINKYTFNLVFSKIYGNNEDKTTDLEKALKYIKDGN